MASRRTSAGQDLVCGGGPSPPEYERPFSVRSSFKFYTDYEEYERHVELANSSSGQPVQSPLLSLSQLLPKAIRVCLADTFFSGTRVGELQESDLKEGLARHGECWAGEEDADPVVTAVGRTLVMGSEPTALDRIDAVKGRMEDYFENPGVEKVFRDATGKFRRGPARVITAALVAGLKPPEFKFGVESALKLKENWGEDPRAVFQVVRDTALEWRVVESVVNRRDQARGKKHVPGRAGGSQQSNQRKPRRNRKGQSTGKSGPGYDSRQSRGSGADAGIPTTHPPSHQQRPQEKLQEENNSSAPSTTAHADTTTKKACLNPNCANKATKCCPKCKMVWFCGPDCEALLRDSHEAFCNSISEEPEATVLLLDGMGYLGPRNFYTKSVDAALVRATSKVATVDVSKKPGVLDQVGYVLSEAGRFTSCIALAVGSANLDAEKEFAKNTNFRQKLRAWVELGGRLIIHGERSGLVGNWPKWFGKTWKCSDHRRTTHECRAKSRDDVHWCKWYSESGTAVTTSISVKATMMTGVAAEEILFGEKLYIDDDLEVEDRQEIEARLAVNERLAAVAFGRFGEGTVSFFGDVNAEETTCAVMAAIARGPRR